MKKIILFLLIAISITTFACRGITNPKNPYFINGNKVYYSYKGEEVKDADINTFENISYSTESCNYRDYGKDNKNVYFKNSKVEGADPESFAMLKQGYYKDKRYVYFYGKRLEGSDSRKEIIFIEGNKDNDCVPWGDGGCIVNNGNKYLGGEKSSKF